MVFVAHIKFYPWLSWMWRACKKQGSPVAIDNLILDMRKRKRKTIVWIIDHNRFDPCDSPPFGKQKCTEKKVKPHKSVSVGIRKVRNISILPSLNNLSKQYRGRRDTNV